MWDMVDIEDDKSMNAAKIPERIDMEWQPIETAPIAPFDKERWWDVFSPRLLLWNKHYFQIGVYRYTKKGRGKWEADGRIATPTHWMPLPDPPAV